MTSKSMHHELVESITKHDSTKSEWNVPYALCQLL